MQRHNIDKKSQSATRRDKIQMQKNINTEETQKYRYMGPQILRWAGRTDTEEIEGQRMENRDRERHADRLRRPEQI